MVVDSKAIAFDVVTCVNRRNYSELPQIKEHLISLGLKDWRLFSIFPTGRAALDSDLQLPAEMFRGMLDFIKETRKEGRIKASFGCEGFLGRYEGDVRDHFYTCQAGVTIGSVLIDGSISACTSIRSDYHQGNIYKGFITSAHITESGLYMLINNKNKLITGKTALKKMVEIRNKLKEKNMANREIFDEINNYFSSHRTILTGYGSIKTYKIKEVNFDKSPQNTNISIKDCNGIKKSISIINYYKNQYNIDIKDINQPLLEAENNIKKKNQKLLPSGKNNNNEKDGDYKIYLVPELVYITGIEDDGNQNNRRNNCRNIINKTKGNPSIKMSAINGIKDLVNSTQHKTIQRNGIQIEEKSPYDLTKEWGINLGSNLTFGGRIIQQPHIFFNKDNLVEPRNGIFRAGNPYKMRIITKDNIFFIYDKSERYNHRKIFNDLMNKFRSKHFEFSDDFHLDKVQGFGLENTSNWESISKSLRNIKVNKGDSFGIIFCSSQLEKFYEKSKDNSHQERLFRINKAINSINKYSNCKVSSFNVNPSKTILKRDEKEFIIPQKNGDDSSEIGRAHV